MFSHIFLHCLLYGCGDEEILLFQAQLLACVMVVIGIEHVHQVSGQILLLNRLAVVTLVKSVQTEACHGLRIPDTQGIHNAVAVSHDGKIVGNGSHCLITLLHEMISAVLVAVYGHVAAEFHYLGILGPAQFKRIAVRQPVVRHLDLETVLNLLFEHTVTVADTAAVSRIPQCCQGIQETGCQTSQAAVAQSGIRLLILKHVDIHAQLLQNFLCALVSLQVDHVIAQGTSHQELHGHIVNHLWVFFVICLLGGHPVADHPVLYGIRCRLKNLLRRCLLQILAEHIHYIVKDTSLEKLFVKNRLLLRFLHGRRIFGIYRLLFAGGAGITFQFNRVCHIPIFHVFSPFVPSSIETPSLLYQNSAVFPTDFFRNLKFQLKFS